MFSLAGAIAGTRMLQSGSSAIRWSVPLSWLAAVIFTILIAIILCKVISAISSRSDCHLLTKMNRMGLAMTIAASALMLAIGFNLGGLVPSVSTLEFQLLVFPAVAIAICLLVKGEAGAKSHRLMERWFDINAEAALAMTLATALVTLIFSFDLRIGNIQLKATPLAPGLLMLAGLAGCELAQNKEVNWMPLASKIGTDALLTPLLAIDSRLSYLWYDTSEPVLLGERPGRAPHYASRPCLGRSDGHVVPLSARIENLRQDSS